MMHNGDLRQAVPFFRVAHLATSLKFYVDGLGFKVTKQWVDEGVLRWCWLERGGAALMLQQFPREGHDAWVPSGRVGEGVSVCFICGDALALYREFAARGLPVSRPAVGNGMWVTSLADPDGYRLDFESVTDALEDAEFEEP